ncbi:MAG: bifunctional 4-hydroxy-2-oxoglutarate aldolase/2-dehydro-3-deoxy-phosphogluconate aldolase [Alphaproteobacteria bacterium]|nr:bifunctional 4-hydroxy-2-oxoglutarate aldolase/2-dehydro-3-deoxy-phosphogluconate aldolase [Alphaproteobacteria bacterium]
MEGSTTSDIRALLKRARVVPVLTVEDDDDAVALASALFAGGLWMLEVTLRTKGALGAVERIARALPQAVVGVGTLTKVEEFAAAANAGARFAVSPGCTAALAAAGRKAAFPYLPGAITPSEVMAARDAGYTTLKFFPCKAAGGTGALAMLAPVFSDVVFCPTGGLTADDFRDYLAAPNVVAAGGTWMMPKDALARKDWPAVTRAAKAATA